VRYQPLQPRLCCRKVDCWFCPERLSVPPRRQPLSMHGLSAYIGRLQGFHGRRGGKRGARRRRSAHRRGACSGRRAVACALFFGQRAEGRLSFHRPAVHAGLRRRQQRTCRGVAGAVRLLQQRRADWRVGANFSSRAAAAAALAAQRAGRGGDLAPADDTCDTFGVTCSPPGCATGCGQHGGWHRVAPSGPVGFPRAHRANARGRANRHRSHRAA
jgi:hypothetical protein